MNIAGPIGVFILIIIIFFISFGLSKKFKIPIQIIALGILAVIIFSGLILIGVLAS